MFTWKPEMSVGVKEIDDQHKTFFGILNELVDAVTDKAGREVIGTIIEKLAGYAEYHFKTEERYFLLFNYEAAQEHIIEHNLLRDRLNEHRRRHFERGEDVAMKLFSFMVDWLAGHLMDHDMRYVECFKEHGLK